MQELFDDLQNWLDDFDNQNDTKEKEEIFKKVRDILYDDIEPLI